MTADQPPMPEPRMTASYDAGVRELLVALRDFTRADQEMRRRLSATMRMNVTDVQALRHVIDSERTAGWTTPRELAAYLGISTASTTKLLDRLTASGHLVRAAHPSDRRSVVVTSTPHAREEVRTRLGAMHERMREIAEAVPSQARGAVVAFLQAMAREMIETGAVDPLLPAPEASPAD
ncbi:MarR family winged helix-turn-helix transcriptional regulator [Nocardioides pacificus]